MLPSGNRTERVQNEFSLIKCGLSDELRKHFDKYRDLLKDMNKNILDRLVNQYLDCLTDLSNFITLNRTFFLEIDYDFLTEILVKINKIAQINDRLKKHTPSFELKYGYFDLRFADKREAAFNNFKEIYKKFEENDDPIGMAECLNKEAHLEMKNKQYENAEEIIKRAKKILTNININKDSIDAIRGHSASIVMGDISISNARNKMLMAINGGCSITNYQVSTASKTSIFNLIENTYPLICNSEHFFGNIGLHGKGNMHETNAVLCLMAGDENQFHYLMGEAIKCFKRCGDTKRAEESSNLIFLLKTNNLNEIDWSEIDN